MMALEEMSQFRLFPMPPIFNFRRATLHARHGPMYPVLQKSSIFSKSNISISAYKEASKATSLMIFDDSYNDMRLKSGPLPFDCKTMVVT
jgi:hypothetical protein